MTRRTNTTAISESTLSLPIETENWLAIVRMMKLSPQQAKVAELLLLSKSLKEMAMMLGITIPTVRSHLQRIYARVGVSDKMALAMRVLALSHQIDANEGDRPI